MLGYSAHIAYIALLFSRGTKVGKTLNLAPQRYTVEFGMVAKVIVWCI